MLDITGCAHLFGGEAALVADLVARLHAPGLPRPRRHRRHARRGLRRRPLRNRSTVVVPPGGSGAMLAPLPLAALRLDHDTVAALDRVGLKRIGQIVGAPRAPLAARFGRTLIRRSIRRSASTRKRSTRAVRRPP